VLVKHCELWTLAAVDELLLLLPSDWANVAELAQRLLQVRLVVVQILHLATKFSIISNNEVVVTRELQAGRNSALYGGQSFIFNKPLRLQAVDIFEVVEVLMEKVGYFGDLYACEGQTSDEDGSVTAEIALGMVECATVHLGDGHVEMEDVCRPDTVLAHQHCLLSGLGIALKHPSVLLAVPHLDSPGN